MTTLLQLLWYSVRTLPLGRLTGVAYILASGIRKLMYAALSLFFVANILNSRPTTPRRDCVHCNKPLKTLKLKDVGFQR